MAILHRATLTPTKPGLITAWLDRQPWGGSGAVEVVGSYRFDDPDGAVGVEGVLLARGATLLHVALTYRAAALADADAALVGTAEHSVLGRRWVYDAAGDPLAVACFERALSGRQEQATLELYDGGELVDRREPTARLSRRPGTAASAGELRLARELDRPLSGAEELVATWDGGEAVVAAR